MFELEYLWNLEEGEKEEMIAIAEALGTDDLAEIVNVHRNGYFTFYSNMRMEEVARELIDECYDIPENIKHYIDYELFAQDLSLDGYEEVANGVIRLDN